MSAAALERVKHLGGWEIYGDKWEALLFTLCRSEGGRSLSPL